MITKTIGEILEETVNLFPDNDALVYTNRNLILSYFKFNEYCNNLAKSLMDIGIKRGDHIAVWANNLPEWIFLQFASAKIGAVLVTVNTYYKSFELEYLLKQSDAKILFLTHGFKGVNYVNMVNKIIPDLINFLDGDIKTDKLPFLKNIVFLGDKKYDGMMNYRDLLLLGKNISDEKLEKRMKSLHYNDTINMQYTSGTTGFPKGVMLSHYNIINNAYFVGKTMGLTYLDRMCIPVPFFHCFGCVLSTLNCVVHGSTMVPIEIFEAEEVLRTVEKEKCTVLQGVPTMFISELNHPNFDKYDLKTLRTGIMAGSSCPIEVMVNTISKMNLKEITICYGLTETSPVLTQTNRHDPIAKRVETVGKPLPNIDIKIIDPKNGMELPPDVPGELIAKGYSVMNGYYKMPSETMDVIRDGWIYTKDLAKVDEEGYFHILGRIDDMIIRGGENVYPREIEEFLFTNEKIQDVSIVGVPSKKYGEEICAFIKPIKDVSLIEDEIHDFCKDGISRFKIPKFIIFCDNFPMTASGKIKKIDLREIAKKELRLINEKT
ncbi:MAG: AMP-binding protein [Candidatus Thermoplasmatota archaeon]